MPYTVFICYRRENADFARGIALQLAKGTGPDKVFMDVDAVGGGRDWKERVVEVLDDQPVVVTLITTKWNSRRGGKPRLHDEKDYIRFELKQALDRGLPVIPVLYEPARWPKAEQLPLDLHPILKFQKVPISQERWDYDTEKLVAALHSLLGEPSAPESAPSPKPTVEPALDAINLLGQTQLSRSMFQESEDQREERLRNESEDIEQKLQARAEMDPFYVRWPFWIAAVAAILAGVAALVGAELLVRGIETLLGLAADRWSWVPGEKIPSSPVTAAILLAAAWAIARTSLGAVAYSYDPRRGSTIFFSRGMFGGWLLAVEDWEPVGYWAAWPIATVVAWVLASVVAWGPFAVWGWSYPLVFWIVLLTYTIPVLSAYLIISVDEIR